VVPAVAEEGKLGVVRKPGAVYWIPRKLPCAKKKRQKVKCNLTSVALRRYLSKPLK
jgi:hypothetical protein